MMSSQAKHVLVTSASRKVPLISALQAAVKRIDPEIKVIAGDTDRGALTAYVADEFWHMPPLDAITEPMLVDACLARGIGYILPTRDGELSFWANARDRLAGVGLHVIISAPESVSRCLDKLIFYEMGAAEGLPVIFTSRSVNEFSTDSFVVKERFGAGGRNNGVQLTREEAINHAKTLVSPIFQPFIHGPEISIDAYLTADQQVHGLVLRRRDKIVSGESQVTTTWRNTELQAQAEEILRRLRLNGPVVMQAILASDGSMQVIECNARFGGASTASIAVGLDLLYWSILERREPGLSLPKFARRAGEIRQVRVPHDIVIDDTDL